MRLLVLALLFALAGPAGALTITVTNTNPSGPGSLRQAVIDANNNIAGGHIINVPAGMGVLAQDGTLPLIRDIELNCGGGSVITTGGFKASAATPLLKLGSFDGLVRTIKVKGCHLQNTSAATRVRAIEATDVVLTLEGVEIDLFNVSDSTGPVPGVGGAAVLLMDQQDTYMFKCNFHHNKASANPARPQKGGAIAFADAGASSTLTYPVFEYGEIHHNSAKFGGAVYYGPGVFAELSFSAVYSNQATDSAPTPAGYGGAIYADDFANIWLFASSFDANSAPATNAELSAGGHFYVRGGGIFATQCTMTRGEAKAGSTAYATDPAGGMYFTHSILHSVSPIAQCAGPGIFSALAANIRNNGSSACVLDGVNVPAGFIAFGSWTQYAFTHQYPLLPGSAAINAGTCPMPDKDQNNRPYNGACDLGAFEVWP